MPDVFPATGAARGDSGSVEVVVVTGRAVDGPVPAGMRVKIGQGTVVISGRPALSARNHTFPLVVSADNGVGTASGQYVFTQQLVIEVS